MVSVKQIQMDVFPLLVPSFPPDAASELDTILLEHAFEVTTDNWGDSVYSCRLCSRRFHNQSNLKRHVKLHDPVQESFPCALCGRRYGRKDTLKYHLKQAHRGLLGAQLNPCHAP